MAVQSTSRSGLPRPDSSGRLARMAAAIGVGQVGPDSLTILLAWSLGRTIRARRLSRVSPFARGGSWLICRRCRQATTRAKCAWIGADGARCRDCVTYSIVKPAPARVAGGHPYRRGIHAGATLSTLGTGTIASSKSPSASSIRSPPSLGRWSCRLRRRDCTVEVRVDRRGGGHHRGGMRGATHALGTDGPRRRPRQRQPTSHRRCGRLGAVRQREPSDHPNS